MFMMYRLHCLWLGVLLSVGCGSVKDSHLADAPVTGADATTRGTVHVTVLDPGGTGAPAVGANVVFLDPDGTLVKRAATDTAGKASADLLPGASVTSIALVNTTTQLQTVLGVKPGDDIVLGSKSADSAASGTFTVTYPAFAGAVGYEIAHPCGPNFVTQPATGAPPPTTATLTFNNSCKLDSMEIVVTPTDANSVPLAVIGKQAVPFVSGGSTAITGTYQGLRSFTASYTNLNPIIASMFMSRAVPDGNGITTSLSVTTPTASQVVNVSGALGTSARIASRFTLATRSFQEIRQTLSGSAATYGLDCAANLLPWINQPSFDAAAGKLLVPLDMTGTSSAKPDVIRVAATYRRTDTVTGATTAFSWTLFAPEAGDIALPALPAEVGNVAPTSADTVTVTALMVEIDAIANYDALRNDINGLIAQFGGTRSPAGTIRLSSSPLGLR